jgi:hypothetical protein
MEREDYIMMAGMYSPFLFADGEMSLLGHSLSVHP